MPLSAKKQYFCVLCKKKIGYISPVNHRNKPIPVYALGRYYGILKFIVNQKYCCNTIPFFDLLEHISFLKKKFNFDYNIVLPIPKKSVNILRHGFNPAELIAAPFITKDVSFFTEIFFKTITTDQVKKKKQERIKKKTPFFIPKESLRSLLHKKILLVDDVYTTGTTIDNVIKVLPKKIAGVAVFVVARQ
jgi:predicted amidophosphoribosyltransferase